MPVKEKVFYAYQIDLHYLNRNNGVDVDAIKWDSQIVENLFVHINNLNNQAKTKRERDSWLMYMDYLDADQHYIFGRLSSALYGTTGELIHADSLVSRPNPKEVREGESQLTYFLIRKSDGLMLLQSNLRMNRPRLEEYIEELGQPVITGNNLTYIQICTLINQSFFQSIRELHTVNNIEIEVTTTEAAANENAVVRALSGDAQRISATSVGLNFRAKRQKSGLRDALNLVRDYKDKRGVTKIVVKGKLAGAEKILRLDDSQERYKKRVEVDTNNQAMLSSIEDAMRGVAAQRPQLRQ